MLLLLDGSEPKRSVGGGESRRGLTQDCESITRILVGWLLGRCHGTLTVDWDVALIALNLTRLTRTSSVPAHCVHRSKWRPMSFRASPNCGRNHDMKRAGLQCTQRQRGMVLKRRMQVLQRGKEVISVRSRHAPHQSCAWVRRRSGQPKVWCDFFVKNYGIDQPCALSGLFCRVDLGKGDHFSGVDQVELGDEEVKVSIGGVHVGCMRVSACLPVSSRAMRPHSYLRCLRRTVEGSGGCTNERRRGTSGA